MIINIEFQIPNNTPATSPYIQRFDLGPNAGFIKGIEIYIPEGHKGLARLKVSTPARQLIPAIGSSVTHIRGEKQTIGAVINSPVYGPPYYLTCEGYNEDSFLAHAFILNIEV